MVGEYSLRGGILDIFPAEASKPIRIELFGDLIESIRRFDVADAAVGDEDLRDQLLPLAEYPKSRELFDELGEPAPGWEFMVPLVRPRSHSLFSLTENPVIVVDEPEQAAAAAERFWKRLLEKPDRPFPCPPEANFYTWPELRETLEGNAELAIRELELLTNNQPNQPTTSQPALRRDRLPAVHGFPRQHPSRRRRGAQSGRARLSRGLLRRDRAANWSGWRTFFRNTRFPSNWAWIRPMPRGRIWPSVPMSRARPPARCSSRD